MCKKRKIREHRNALVFFFPLAMLVIPISQKLSLGTRRITLSFFHYIIKFCLDSFLVKDVRIDYRNQSHYYNSGKADPNSTEEACCGNEDTSDDPKPTCQAVCFVPVFFAVQRPRNFNTYGVILLTFGHIIAENYQQKTEESGSYRFHGNFFSHGYGIHKGREQDAQAGNYPEYKVEYFFGVISAFGIGTSNDHCKPLYCKHDQRQTEYCKSLTAPTVYLALGVPMCWDLIRQLIPKDDSRQNRQKEFFSHSSGSLCYHACCNVWNSLYARYSQWCGN